MSLLQIANVGVGSDGQQIRDATPHLVPFQYRIADGETSLVLASQLVEHEEEGGVTEHDVDVPLALGLLPRLLGPVHGLVDVPVTLYALGEDGGLGIVQVRRRVLVRHLDELLIEIMNCMFLVNLASFDISRKI